MANINLKLLQTFVLAVEHGSFRKAADASNRSPSAVSMQIRDLEAQIGIALFNRSAHTISLTPDGQILYDQVAQAIEHVEASLDQIKDVAARRRTKVRIACVPSLAASRLGRILATFKLRYPRSIVEVVEASTATALGLIRDQQVELFIGPEAAGANDVSFEPVIADKIVACVPKALHSGETTFRFGDLESFPHIALNHKSSLRGLIDQLAAEADVRLDLRYEVESAHSALSFVSAGLGICLLSRMSVWGHPAPDTVIVPLDHPMAYRMVGIVTARGHVHHNFSGQLIDLIRSDLQALDRSWS
ncbi:LysR family transcriptional regulator [Acuticoccus sediminis]|uniref:LysR family transcriptional regulator n=1 Tax=Acuticoccus sediminis TaxID=2184697 RepID=A0A8B2NJ56_9HYPH|nr:LysR family transcriptional regulator [Acuticoccus sediminis]RAH98316.1 LysR family transcriptional regulator [Acuticoccus sediminis]